MKRFHNKKYIGLLFFLLAGTISKAQELFPLDIKTELGSLVLMTGYYLVTQKQLTTIEKRYEILTDILLEPPANRSTVASDTFLTKKAESMKVAAAGAAIQIQGLVASIQELYTLGQRSKLFGVTAMTAGLTFNKGWFSSSLGGIFAYIVLLNRIISLIDKLKLIELILTNDPTWRQYYKITMGFQ